MQVKTFAVVFASVFNLIAFGSAYPHGDHNPKHGGTVGRGDDQIVIEFVVEKGIVTLYVESEEGKPIATEGVKATLTLIAPQRPGQEVKLISAGENKFTATGLKPVPGDRLRARITLPSGEELESVSLVGN
jgi:hypothetical protein